MTSAEPVKLYAILLSVSLCAISATAQVEIVNIDMLRGRLATGLDTTFVVNMWATWCKPCVAELPYFEQLSRTQSATPLKVLLVSVDAKKDLQTKVEPFIAKRGFTAEVVLLWPMAIDGIDSSWSGAIPATLLVKGQRRRFIEQEFTNDELIRTVDDFIKSETKP